MQKVRIAKKYTQALWVFAQEQKHIEVIYKDMIYINQFFKNHNDISSICSHPLIDNKTKKSILQAIFSNVLNPKTFFLFDLLSKKNRFFFLYTITAKFIQQYKIQNRIQDVYVSTTYTLSEDLKKKIQDFILKKFNFREIIMIENINKKLQGGFTIQVNDKKIDCSIANYLKKLQKVLSQP